MENRGRETFMRRDFRPSVFLFFFLGEKKIILKVHMNKTDSRSPGQVGQHVPGFGGYGCWHGVMHCFRVSVITPALQDFIVHGSSASVHSVPLSRGTPLYTQPVTRGEINCIYNVVENEEKHKQTQIIARIGVSREILILYYFSTSKKRDAKKQKTLNKISATRNPAAVK